jgi:hypothetical protein
MKPKNPPGDPMTLGNMRDHVDDLCKRYDISISWCARPYQAKAVREFEQIWIAPIRSKLSYATALHEIGML